MVRNLRANVIDCEILTGIRRGDRVIIPRVSLCPNDTNLPFQIKRTQFPLRLSYALTINKSQGQTFEKVGIFLRRPCFSHGQLYVAFSRARSFQAVKVQIVNTFKQGYVGDRWGAKSNGLPSRGAPRYVNFSWIYK
ncbi:ATP-dependent DNA helicase PIF6-like [Hydractinia symbiolongicarpus]|uniref:ATP-dependent DNA helicase PIF6-like n=1 Tax=Hydractinia symbiolongicarpus TaxID=13093 RepID=UPI00254E8057|nr:ATP-dependent DNA helicase PIF6-like [Hydractinia symbiolongicarpus]